MNKETLERAEEVDKEEDEAYDVAGFPIHNEEFESVMDINESMMEARNNWSASEKPTYEANADTKEAAFSGTVRAIDRESGSGANEDAINFGLDTGADGLEWVEVTDTGERSLSNPYVRLCEMYGVHPESVQDFYNEEIQVFNVNYRGVMIRCPYPVLGQLWSFGAAHYKHGLFKVTDKDWMEGVLPTRRFFVAYGIAVAGSYFLSSISLVVGGVLLFLACIMMLWGVYAKAYYEVLPILVKRAEYAKELYKHGDLF